MTDFNLPAGGTLFQNGPIVVHGGSSGNNPGIQFYSARVGFYAPGNDTLSVRILGSEVLGFTAAGVSFTGTVAVDSLTVNSITSGDSSLDIAGLFGTAGVGGGVFISGGGSVVGNGGTLSLSGGAVIGSGTGGAANLKGGSSSGGAAGEAQINGSANIVPATYMFTGTPAATDQAFFIAQRAMVIKSVSQVHSVAAGGTSTLTVTKDTTPAAPGAGTAIQTGSFNLNATANTVQTGTLAASAATLTLAAGDRLSVKFANAIQSSAGIVVTVGMMPA